MKVMDSMLRLSLPTGLASLLVVLVQPACSASVDANSGGASTSGAGGQGGATAVTSATVSGAGGQGGAMAGAGGSVPSECSSFDGAVLAIDKLYLGGRTFDDKESPLAWKEFGFDLDGESTAADFSKHCKPAANGSTSAFGDGLDGRDNSFGRNVRPTLETLVPSLDTQANDAITAGQFTQIFTFAGLEAGGDMDPLNTKVYGGGAFGKAPSWKGDDCWPVLYETLKDPSDVGSAKTAFASGKLVKNVWTSNGATDFDLTLNVAGQSVPIKVYGARMSVQLAPTHQGGALGQIGGYLKTEEFVQTLRSASGAINPAACAIFDSSLADQLRRASDILDDGTQDPTKVCNAISVGLGFTLRQVGFGAVSPKASDPIDYCK
jgi:hypothetical protein